MATKNTIWRKQLIAGRGSMEGEQGNPPILPRHKPTTFYVAMLLLPKAKYMYNPY